MSRSLDANLWRGVVGKKKPRRCRGHWRGLRFHIRLAESLRELDVLTVVADGDPQQDGQIGRSRDELDRTVNHRY